MLDSSPEGFASENRRRHSLQAQRPAFPGSVVAILCIPEGIQVLTPSPPASPSRRPSLPAPNANEQIRKPTLHSRGYPKAPSIGFVAFRRDPPTRSLCDGLPHHHLPPSGFLTLSMASSRAGFVVLFHTTPARRLLTFRAFPTRTAVTPLDALCSHAVHPVFRPLTQPFHLAQLQSLAPPEHPSPGWRLFTFTQAAALLAFLPFEVSE